ncbi:hypothetical protein [uncultured Methanobrevibacter sp.]|uniref:hypothetical protein n=1 Tax=uncultured Methanobrevibacter sp. TaxID=253161 RepID=UPI002600F913|nr:hypothetical protein [uncultured Methanobrevibacter sp.]
MNFTTKELYDKICECIETLKKLNENNNTASYSTTSAQFILENCVKMMSAEKETPLLKYNVAANLFESLAQYANIKSVYDLRNYILESYKEYMVNFKVCNIINNASKSNGTIYEKFANDLTAVIDSDSIASDIKSIAKANPWSNSLKSLVESIDFSNKTAVSNNNCTVSCVYSPVIMTDDGMIFHLHGKDYISDGKSIKECAKVNDIAYNNVLNGLAIAKINGDEINFYGQSKVLNFNVNEGTLKLGDLDLSESNSYEIKDAILVNQLYNYRDIYKADIVAKFFESYDCLKKFSKITDISSNNFENLFLTVIAVEEGYYVNKVNGGMSLNTLEKVDTASQLVECAKSFINYDLSNVVIDNLVEEGNKQAAINKKRNEINSIIEHYEQQKEKVQEAINKYGQSEELKEALNILTEEIRKNEKELQKTYESKKDEYVEATIVNPIAGFKKGDVVLVNALDYTTKSNDEEVDIDHNGKKMKLVKKFIEVQI